MLMRQATPTLSVRNLLLRGLKPASLDQLLVRAQLVELVFRSILARADEPLRYVHFVENGTVSMISRLEDGDRAEVGLVGYEGMVGLSALFGAPTSPLESMVQVAGAAYRLSVADFRKILADMPDLAAASLRYVDAFHAQVVQTAVCAGHHLIEQRLARWLLMTHDRIVDDNFPMTQEFMAAMLGVQRPGITLAVRTLTRAGMVTHSGGRFTLVDRAGLEAASCECYAHAQKRYAKAMQPKHAEIATAVRHRTDNLHSSGKETPSD
jgi:CRP-like cAMP-binding protein